MATSAQGVPTGNRPARGRTRALVTLLVVLGGALLGAGTWAWRRREPVPRAPAVDLDGVDPEVAAGYRAACAGVAETPRSAAPWGELGMFLLAHGFPRDSRPCFAEAERLDPRDARWPYFQAFTLLFEEPPAHALPKLERAVALTGGTPDTPTLRLAEVLAGEGRAEEAERLFQQVLRQDPGNARAHLGLGRLAWQQGRLPEAQPHLECCKENPSAAKPAHVLLGDLYERQGDRAAAARARRRAEDLGPPPDWPDAFADEAARLVVGKRAAVAVANQLLGQGRYAEAGAAAEQLTRDYPGEGRAWLLLGRSWLQRQDFEAAERPLRVAAQLLPESVDAHFALGTLLDQQGRFAEAEVCYRKVTQLKPSSAAGYYNLGRCLEARGEDEAASAAYRAALRYKPNLTEAHRRLAERLAAKGRAAEAVQHLRDLLQVNPEDAAGRRRLEELLRPGHPAPASPPPPG